MICAFPEWALHVPFSAGCNLDFLAKVIVYWQTLGMLGENRITGSEQFYGGFCGDWVSCFSPISPST